MSCLSSVLFIYGDVCLGGSETLLLRIGRSLNRDKVNITLLCNRINETMKSQFENAGVKVVSNNSHDNSVCISELQALDENSLVINLGLTDFLYCEKVKKQLRKDFKNILYVVHPYTLFAAGKKHRVLQQVKLLLMKLVYKRPIQGYLKNGNIIFMDEQSFKHSDAFYGFRVEDMKKHIIRLPIETSSIDDQTLKTKCENRHNCTNILTIARADFPFKGYMKGLIQSCSNIDGDISLTIISDGNGFRELKTWVDDANEKIKHPIELIKGVPYDKLFPYYSSCHIYVGMGTTVLEAADKGAICIPVAFYTYKCNADKTFDESPNRIALEKYEGRSVDDLLNNLLRLDDSTFLKKMLESKKIIEDNYSTDSFIRKLKKRKVNANESYVSLPLNAFVDLQRMTRKQMDKKGLE